MNRSQRQFFKQAQQRQRQSQQWWMAQQLVQDQTTLELARLRAENFRKLQEKVRNKAARLTNLNPPKATD